MNSLINEIKAYAKINLHLEVLNKRRDGYHNILGLFCSVNLYDLLKLVKADIYNNPHGSIDVTIDSSGGIFRDIADKIPLKDNLIYKATELYFKDTGKSGRIIFSLTKNIPAGGGLGGGSTDAAAALKLLNLEFCLKTDLELAKISSILGADVPYCLTGGYAICEGIGDIIESIEGNFDSNVLIINNGIHVDTKKAYKLLERNEMIYYNEEDIKKKKVNLKKCLISGNIEAYKHLFKNDFEKKVFELYPEIGILKNKLINFNADFSIMTGSGSTLISLFRNKNDAENAYQKFKNEIKFIHLTEFV